MVVKLDEQSLDNLRVKSLENAREYFGDKIVKFTCDDCESRYTCCYVFDLYNTDGDCLANK